MLQSLTMKNVALIESATISFTDGLNVLSGETGSGKSVIVDSMNFVLGGKADRTMIRSGTEECSVQAVFAVDEKINAVLTELGFDTCEDETLMISRKMTTDGKGEIRVNGTPSSSAVLKKITSRLVDIHGQSEHLSLLKNNLQLKLIDEFDPKIGEIQTELTVPSRKLREIREKIQLLGGDPGERAKRLDILSFQIKEIEDAEISENEEEELLSQRKKLQNAEKISENLQEASGCLRFDAGALDKLRTAERDLLSISALDPEYDAIHERIFDLKTELEDISDTVASLLDNFDTDERELDKIESRLDQIHNLYRKYGGNYVSMTAFLQQAKEEFDTVSNCESVMLDLEKQRAAAVSEAYLICKKLRETRLGAAQKFQSSVLSELKGLGMGKSVVEVAFSDFPEREETENRLTENGFDSIEILLSPNLGEPVKPLAKIISGGEMSRFMLAIKAQTVQTEGIATCVFDEIDTGISGQIAKTVAEKFYDISKNTQVIAISHLPQIAAMSDHSVLIEKVEEAGKTYTKVKSLSAREKVAEVTRLVGGSPEDKTATAHAENMISICNEYKEAHR